jgi:Domain of unknown function (DUF4129)
VGGTVSLARQLLLAVDVDRDEAAKAARDELTKGIYHRDEPGVISRFLGWVLEQLVRLLDAIATHSPGGGWGLLALLTLLVVAGVVIRWRVGALARAAARPSEAVFAGRHRTAAEHRAEADAAAARGDLETACRERFRALLRELEERTVLDERPGRTADEVAWEVAALAPGAAAAMRVAARAFDEVCYGGRHAMATDDAAIRTADEAVRQLRGPTVAAASGTR